MMTAASNRVAVIEAVRTPFVKSFGAFDFETPLALSVRVATEAITRSGVAASDIDECIWGAVVPQTKNPNVARDLIIYAGLSRSIPGYTLTRACASSLQTVQCGADAIRLGRANLILAGGVEVLSDVPITYTDEARRFLTKLSRARSMGEKLSLISNVKFKSFLPVPPALAEPFTGLTMGDSAEIMAVKNNITRQRQDEYTVHTHTKASKAIAAGELRNEIVPVFTKSGPVTADNIVRGDTTLDALSKLRPVFDKKNGTITAGNASALTDGAAAVLLCSESYATQHKQNVLGYVVDSVTVGVDPSDQLLIGPALAIPKLLLKHGLKIEDVGVFEIHEAFAAQVLSCLDSMASDTFCKERLGLSKAFGLIPPEKMNIDGGSLAYGHPFGATGGRLVGRALRIAKRVKSRYAVIAVCTAGGMGQAMLLEIKGE